VVEPRFDAKNLPFTPLSLTEMLAAKQPELEVFLTQIYKSVAQSSSLNEKVNTESKLRAN
jgi:serine/threonine-protein kinase ULK4